MEIIRDNVNKAEVVSAWLTREYNSRKDFKESIQKNAPDTIPYIFKTDFDNAQSNACRWKALTSSTRGGYAEPVFSRISVWKIARLTLLELGELKAVESGSWHIMSNGSFKFKDIAYGLITNPKLRDNEPTRESANYIMDNAEKLTEARELPIAIGSLSALTVMEGVHRISGTLVYYNGCSDPKAKDIFVGIKI